MLNDEYFIPVIIFKNINSGIAKVIINSDIPCPDNLSRMLLKTMVFNYNNLLLESLKL